MAQKQFIVISNVHMGKTPYTLIEGDRNPWNTLTTGNIFEAEEADMEKALLVGAVQPHTGRSTAKEPTPVIATAMASKKGTR